MTAELTEAAIAVAVAIEGADSLASIQEAVRSFSAPFGYNRFVLFSASAGRDEAVERIYWVEGDWLGEGDRVDAETYIRRCPVNQHIIDSLEPFFWTKTHGESGDLYRIVRAPRGTGIHGLQVPVFGPLGLIGAMSLGGEQIDSSPKVRTALALVASAAFLAAQRLLEAPTSEGHGMLTDREREILAWTAAGRRQGEIAATLQLSARTIENHLRRIRQRLGVATTAEAIRVAIRTRDIVA